MSRIIAVHESTTLALGNQHLLSFFFYFFKLAQSLIKDNYTTAIWNVYQEICRRKNKKCKFFLFSDMLYWLKLRQRYCDLALQSLFVEFWQGNNNGREVSLSIWIQSYT